MRSFYKLHLKSSKIQAARFEYLIRIDQSVKTERLFFLLLKSRISSQSALLEA